MNPTERVKKKYRVYVTERITNYGVVEVEAFSEFEAEVIAEDQFDSAEHDDGTVEVDAFVLDENAIPFHWSVEAADQNRDNPNLPCPERQPSLVPPLAIQSK